MKANSFDKDILLAECQNELCEIKSRQSPIEKFERVLGEKELRLSQTKPSSSVVKNRVRMKMGGSKLSKQDQADERLKHKTRKRPCHFCAKLICGQNMAKHILCCASNTGPKKMQEVLSCLTCDYTTTHRNRLKEHSGVHSNVKQFSCPHCRYCARYKSSLKYHSSAHHSDCTEHPPRLRFSLEF